MTFERNLYAEGLYILRRTLPYAALAIAGEYVIQAAKEVFDLGSGMAFASIFIWSYLAFAAHAEILLPADRDKSEEQKRVLGFALRTFGLFLLVAIPVFVVVVLVAPAISPTFNREVVYVVTLLFGLATASIALLVVLGLLGTLLPAYVAGIGLGIGAALSRTPTQFFYIFGRLIIGPGLVLAVSVVVSFGVVYAFDAPEDLIGKNYLPDPITSISLIIIFAIQTYATVLTAVVLSRAYLRSERLVAEA